MTKSNIHYICEINAKIQYKYIIILIEICFSVLEYMFNFVLRSSIFNSELCSLQFLSKALLSCKFRCSGRECGEKG